MTPKYTQTARGSFSFQIIPGTPHCGPGNERIQAAEYSVSITFRDNPLDSDGFLLDNTWFANYFRSLATAEPISISCELLCRRIADDIADASDDRVESCTVSLSAVPGVWISCACDDLVRDSESLKLADLNWRDWTAISTALTMAVILLRRILA